jgi:hypothetical protein
MRIAIHKIPEAAESMSKADGWRRHITQGQKW